MQDNPSSPARRTLKFDTLDEAVRDAEMLLARGYDRAGHWTLGQVCGHLAAWMRFPLDGYPRPSVPIRIPLWLMKQFVGRRMLRRILTTNSLPTGVATLRETIPAADEDDAAAVSQLRQTVERFNAHSEPMRPSPFFGEFNRQTATHLQLVHCAHHLSYLVPKPS